jgi:hypothetical protein
MQDRVTISPRGVITIPRPDEGSLWSEGERSTDYRGHAGRIVVAADGQHTD